MDKLPVFVGLDYHQDSVQVCVLDSGGKVLGNRAYSTTRGGSLSTSRRTAGRVERPWNRAKGLRTLRRV